MWNGAITVKRQKIVFGHWDWIFGVFMMYPVLMLFVCALCIALDSSASLALRSVFTTVLLAVGYSAFGFYKSGTFDVFRVGLRYFKPNRWRYTPLQR